MKKYKTILATTYAVNPLKGSEDGMGWNFVKQIARFNKVIAITRENNQVHIEKFMKENPSELYENIQFLYFDLPYWMRFWKKGGRGAMLYYWMWQRGVVSFVKKNKVEFDICHNLNFHNDWTPSYLWKLKKPFAWGPIGHHPLIPKQYLKPYKKSYYIKDRLTWMVKKYFWNISLSLRKTVKHADFIYCMNNSVPQVLNLKDKFIKIVPSVATDDFGFEKMRKDGKFTLISAGRLVPLKGYDLSILAFASFMKTVPEKDKDNCEFLIVGSGPEMKYYEQLCEKNGVKKYVKFISWIERSELMKIFKTSSAFLFPSHEGAGMVVPEALSFGLPIICTNNCGPGEFIDKTCGFAVEIQDYDNTVIELGKAITTLYENPELREQMSVAARKRFVDIFHWDRRGELLKEIYSEL